MTEQIKIIFAQSPASELDRAIEEGIATYLFEHTDQEMIELLKKKNGAVTNNDTIHAHLS